jgi:hypothetical protein
VELNRPEVKCVGVEKVESGIVRSGIKELSYPEWRCSLTFLYSLSPHLLCFNLDSSWMLC